jgi:uncharacterized UPF0160 family protein
MTSSTSGAGPLEKLVLQVCHVDLSECENSDEFKEALAIMEHNLQATLTALASYIPANTQVSRAAKNVKSRAVHLLDLCRSLAQSVDDSEKWRDQALLIIANYEQFRISAGHLYQIAVPRSSFGVLKAAL